MKYRDILGYSKKQLKKKVVKEKIKQENTILDSVKKELNEWSYQPPTEKRWSKTFNGSKGLTEFEQTGGKDFIKEVGNAQVHKKMIKKIEDGEGYFRASVQNYIDFLKEQGHTKEAQELSSKYTGFIKTFLGWLKTKWVRIIRKLI